MNLNRKKVIIGSNGNIARQLKEQFPDAMVIDRRQFEFWDNPNELRTIFKDEPIEIYVAIGILSSKSKISELERVNVQIPKLIADSIKGTDSRIVTFGSIMEKDQRICSSNPYIHTKKKLSEYLQSNLQEDEFLHLRLHTLYGGKKLNSEMFLGQLFISIKNGTEFLMSSGRQIREYHHIEDDLKAMELLQVNGHIGIQEISHGEVFTLIEIAEQVLYYFDAPKLLIAGKMEEPSAEIFSPLGIRSKTLKEFQFRPTIKSIANYLLECMAREREQS